MLLALRLRGAPTGASINLRNHLCSHLNVPLLISILQVGLLWIGLIPPELVWTCLTDPGLGDHVTEWVQSGDKKGPVIPGLSGYKNDISAQRTPDLPPWPSPPPALFWNRLACPWGCASGGRRGAQSTCGAMWCLQTAVGKTEWIQICAWETTDVVYIDQLNGSSKSLWSSLTIFFFLAVPCNMWEFSS